MNIYIHVAKYTNIKICPYSAEAKPSILFIHKYKLLLVSEWYIILCILRLQQDVVSSNLNSTMEKFIRKQSGFCLTFKISKGRHSCMRSHKVKYHKAISRWLDKQYEGKRLLSERLLREVCELRYNDITSLQKRVEEITLSSTQMHLL